MQERKKSQETADPRITAVEMKLLETNLQRSRESTPNVTSRRDNSEGEGLKQVIEKSPRKGSLKTIEILEGVISGS